MVFAQNGMDTFPSSKVFRQTMENMLVMVANLCLTVPVTSVKKVLTTAISMLLVLKIVTSTHVPVMRVTKVTVPKITVRKFVMKINVLQCYKAPFLN